MMEFYMQYWTIMVERPFAPVFYGVFILGIILLLGELPHTPKATALKLLEFAVCWYGMEVFSGIYFALLGDNYLNQVREVLFVVLYGAFRCKYPLAKRFVMGGAGWAAEILIIAIFGFSGMTFGWLDIAIMVPFYGGAVWFLRRFAIENFKLAPQYYVGGIIVMALFGVISSVNWHVERGFQPYYLALSIVLLIMLLLFYFMFYAINQSYSRNLELLAQQAGLEAQQRLLLLSQKNYEELKILRHEIKNHDAYIEMLVSNRQYEDLEEYLKGRSSKIPDFLKQVSCGNLIIDAVVNQNIAVAKLEGVRFEVKAVVPAKLSVRDADLFALLNNLLSNAIESSEAAQIPDPVIQLQIYQERGYLFIHLENPVSDAIDAKERLRLHTTKENGELHGYGTRVIQRIAESYDGYVQYDIQNQRFISDLMLAATEV